MSQRLDVFLVKNKLAETRNKSQELIKNGFVLVNGKITLKSSAPINENDKVEIKENEINKYVGRGGLKLEHALKEFKIDPKNKVCLDIGASTGGFTDCLLQKEAKKIYAVDVGTSQLAEKLKNDPRVISLENTDIRNFNDVKDKIDLIVIDISFISLKQIIPSIEKFLESNTEIIALIKPQFEAGKGIVDKHGIVKSEEKRKEIVDNLINWFKENNYKVLGFTNSPITGEKGNVEYLIYLKK